MIEKRIMKVFKNGRVTIPKKFRELAGMRPGADVDFIVGDDEAEIILVKSSEQKPVGRLFIRKPKTRS